MTTQQKSSKTINILLWIAQTLLAVSFIWTAMLKLFQPIEQLSAMWPWTGQVSVAFLKFTGVIDLLSGIGIILPALLRIKPVLTPVTAIGIIILMISAGIFHISRGEASVIGVNIVFAIIAAFIAWGRFLKAPISQK